MMIMPPIPTADDPYWEKADWLPPWYILDHWCQQDAQSRHAKQQALFSACERGEIYYRRSDGKTFDDPIHELSARGILLIDRDSFVAWVTTVEGQSPLPARARKQPPYPGWASPGAYQFDQEQWNWVPVTTSVSAPAPVSCTSRFPDPAPPKAGTPPTWVLEMEMRFAEKQAAAAPVEASRADSAVQEIATVADEMPEKDAYPSEDKLRKSGVPADEIIKAFSVKLDPIQNEKWWTERFTNPNRYKKILAARVQKGKASRGGQHFRSWWNPFLVASWLIESKHMRRDRAVRMLRQSFPDFAVDDHLL